MTPPSPLLTDLYQLIMAKGYWESGMAEQHAVFHLFCRRNPFQGDFIIHCGLAEVIDFLQNYQFSDHDIAYLSSLTDSQQQPLFPKEFLQYCQQLSLSCQLFAMPEGQIAFPHEPLLRIEGPILQCQLLETALINLTNFASLIATKAARVCTAAAGDTVMEFGLRRAQGPNGGLTASRAAYIGGCTATSNVLAGQRFDIPVHGTMGHSWVMAFDNELAAFKTFVQSTNNTILLVDTYDTIQGVKNAITIGQQLKQQNRELLGIRLDSGNLVDLSQNARALLDQAGFTQTQIIASGDLEEHRITELKRLGTCIDVWGVGTRLVTAYDQPSLDVAYKLGAIQSPNGEWISKLKISSEPTKTTNPGIQQVRRYYQDGQMQHDVIYDMILGINPDKTYEHQDLLIPIMQAGKIIYQSPSVQQIRQFCQAQQHAFSLHSKEPYSVTLEPKLLTKKQALVSTAH